MASSGTASKTKNTAKAGGQRSFEDELRETGVRGNLAKDNTKEKETETTETVADNLPITQGNEGTESGDMSTEESNDLTSETIEGVGTETGKDITVSSVLEDAGIDPEDATKEQTALAEDIVAGAREGGTPFAELKTTLEDLIKKGDNSEGSSEGAATGNGKAVTIEAVASNGQINTQPNLLTAIKQADYIYTRFQFGHCGRWFKITKKEALQCAQTVQAFEKPEKHGLTYFGTMQDNCLFMGHFDAAN